jgi:hypothetical protein
LSYRVTYSCSGTLVKQRGAESRNPYILTAKHCIDSPAAAATLQLPVVGAD